MLADGAQPQAPGRPEQEEPGRDDQEEREPVIRFWVSNTLPTPLAIDRRPGIFCSTQLMISSSWWSTGTFAMCTVGIVGVFGVPLSP